MSYWTRNEDITKYTSEQIRDILLTNPILIGHTSTAKQFFETDYEYEFTNCDLTGTPLIEDITKINSWEDVEIINNKGEVQYLVNPHLYKCSDYTVNIKNGRLKSI